MRGDLLQLKELSRKVDTVEDFCQSLNNDLIEAIREVDKAS